ncbi:SDR family NAD(P)-dependent oxidoreductase [Microbulbifer hainanensis]|uniref:SDR family NAD(P)-dependent oxidoreductase n=1 Tax=Microbulbifer hainanensis TaxID=2735675 RepID=UPI00186958AD|nr:SDR family NAD(P)-dependent oxidoreductase [Microbulbifer hainanensis]
MKYFLITGASAGIGRAMAEVFARNGHNLIIVARSEDELKSLKGELEAEYGITVEVIPCDLAEPGAGHKLYEQCRQYELEGMINNAGFGDFSLAWDMDKQKADAMLNLNVHALTELSLDFLHDYKDTDATLINVASIGGYKMFPTAVTYCATKFYVAAFTEGVAHDLQDENKPMRAKVLAPAATRTDFFEKAYTNAGLESEDEEKRDEYFPPEKLAEYAYELYQSDKVVGYVGDKFQFELRDPMFDRV